MMDHWLKKNLNPPVILKLKLIQLRSAQLNRLKEVILSPVLELKQLS